MLVSSSYGKSNVKFLKVDKSSTIHNILEANVQLLLRGDFDIAYTLGDNKPIIPTDTVKNTILVLAQQSENIWPIEKFAAILVGHFVSKYGQIKGIEVTIIANRWERINEHPHSFRNQGPETRATVLDYDKTLEKLTLSSGIHGLTVLKSTGSMFYGYNVCEFTTLPPTFDRVLSTDVDVTWKYDSEILTLDLIKKYADDGLFDDTYTKARSITLDIFCKETSASVQATMYNMSQKILQLVKQVSEVSYELPNKHYILFDLKWKGIDNQDLYYPSPDPNGLIKCTVGRDT